jgi:hypothetical protein
LRQGNELGAAVHPVGRQTDMLFVPPLDKAFQQIAVGAAYVQKVTVVGDGIEDQFPFRAPPLVASAKSRLPDGSVSRKYDPSNALRRSRNATGSSVMSILVLVVC